MKTVQLTRFFGLAILLSSANVFASPQHISVLSAPFSVDLYGFDNSLYYQKFSSKPSQELSIEQMNCGKKQYAEVVKALVSEPYKDLLGPTTVVHVDVNQYGNSIIDDSLMQLVPPNQVTFSKDLIYVRAIVRLVDKHTMGDYTNECELETAAEIRSEFESKMGITQNKRAQALLSERARTEAAIRSINKVLLDK